ncbi:FGGY-family carbohydrate kinase [Streptomyces sp. DT2A-34]|uniref:FGGY-family carbohydrate kinase n=1 Tax=Streptomyces sp. DT2A-34 TaxID=3051182 RepID=UPI00265B8746|nr:FGGY-family carbohydrate kinase [Streptomyces sp. DT2A-34]MDO0910600.1 FGGY-family carbohydrate kinase [Streptomyces sp. DT2A-34]
MARDLVLGVDAGHTVTKAVLFDAAGRPVAQGSGTLPLSTPRPYWVERGMDDVWRMAHQAIAACLAAAGPDAGRAVAAVGVAGHGDGLYAVDERGRPVRAAIVAMDTRAEPVPEEWRGTAVWSRALDLSGTVPFAGSPAALLAWLARHEPGVLQRARWLLSCKDWLRLRLTGVAATDPTDASASFTDMRRGGYAPELLDLYGLGAFVGLLPPVLACDAVSGTVTREAAALTGLTAGTPVVTGAHDVDAAALGIGGTTPGELCLIAGSFSINQVVGKRPVVDPRWQVRHFVRPGQWMTMSTSPASVANLEWFLRVTGAPSDQRDGVHEVIGREVEAHLDGPSEVLFHPFVYGSPHPHPTSARSSDCAAGTAAAICCRALMEGVVLNHRWHVDALCSKLPITGSARLTGGAARSEVWSQMSADALRRPVVVTDVQESAARGAALLAATAGGLLDDVTDPRAGAAVLRRHEPDPERVAVLDEAYAVYQEAVDALGPVWARLDAPEVPE